jgi:hypothetical protein
VPQQRSKFRQPTEQQRLEEYFWKLEGMIPMPPNNWAANVKPYKWDKILKEQKNNPNGPGEREVHEAGPEGTD